MLHKVVVYINIYNFFQQAYGNFPDVQIFFFFFNTHTSHPQMNFWLAHLQSLRSLHLIMIYLRMPHILKPVFFMGIYLGMYCQ